MARKRRNRKQRKKRKNPNSNASRNKGISFVSEITAGRMMSKCARDYLDVLIDPFSGKTACVPSEFNFPSMKHFIRVYGTMNTGAGNFGFVTFQPFKAAWSGWAANFAPVTYSGAAFTGTSVAAAPGTGVFEANTASPYSSGANAQSIESRLVAAGIRVRNITQLLARGGSLVGAETLNHTSLTGQDTSTIMLQDTSSPLPHTDGEWNCVTYHPEDPVEIQWLSSGTAGAGVYQNNFLGFLCSAPLGASQAFEFECVAVFEAKGTLVHGLKPSISDPLGFGQVQNIVSSPEARKPYSEAWGKLATRAGALLGIGVNAYQAYVGQRQPRRDNRINYPIPRIEEID